MTGKTGKLGKQGKIDTDDRGPEDKLGLFVVLRVNDEQLSIDLDEKLRIPSVDVLTPQKACNMMAENPSLHARWNVLANQAAFESDHEKIAFEVWVKEKSKSYRSDLASDSGRRVTDKQVEEAVMTDPEYMRRYDKYLKTRENAANIRSVAMGFGERGERLVNVVSMMKWERPTASVKHSGKNSEVYADDDETEKAAFTDNKNDDDDNND